MPPLLQPRRDLMRRRRVLKLVLIPALGLLFFAVSLALTQHQSLPLNAALDSVLARHIEQLPTSPSALKIRVIQEFLASATSVNSPRDFRVPENQVAKVCALLRAKKILLVGPETTYNLHSLWLHALQIEDHRTHECPGPDFCNFHHICLPPGYPTSQDRYKFPPKDTELVTTGSAILRYVLSTSLYTAKDKEDAGYIRPVVDPATGVRLKNACWLHHARKTDVILMNRGPIPAPAWTFAGHSAWGNWSFAGAFPRHLGPGKTLALQIINAAFHVTATRFIPEVLQSVETLQADPLIRKKTLAWHASWFSGSVNVEIFHLTRKVEDPWALYYDAQVYMQNYMLRKLLPRYGVYFLSRIAASRIQADNSSTSTSPQAGLRFPLVTTNAEDMATAFLKSLIELLELAK